MLDTNVLEASLIYFTFVLCFSKIHDPCSHNPTFHRSQQCASIVVRSIHTGPTQLCDRCLESLHILLAHWRDTEKNAANQLSSCSVMEQRNIPVFSKDVQEASKRAGTLRELDLEQALVGSTGSASSQEPDVFLRQLILGEVEGLQAGVVQLLDQSFRVLPVGCVHTVEHLSVAGLGGIPLVVSVLELGDGACLAPTALQA
mmetsp:Transcript_14320/g.32940  ORF Transcript_14320/g.32940 Transcript_14320/m.32940 type:complete len:201 (-) Transcript_14320:170-772(-)